MTTTEAAVANFSQGYNCAQSVAAAFAESVGMPREQALRAVAGFGGGIGRTAGVCGAVSGAVFILGLKYGAVHGDDTAAKERAYERVREFIRRYTELHDTTICRDLLGCDISTPAGMQEMRDRKLHTTVCSGLVADAARILEEMLRA